MEIRLNDMRKQSLMQFTSKRTRKYPRLTDLIIIGMRDKGVNIHFPVSHMVFLSSTSLHNRYVGWSLKVKPIRNNSRYFFVFRIVASVRNVLGGTWSVERWPVQLPEIRHPLSPSLSSPFRPGSSTRVLLDSTGRATKSTLICLRRRLSG